MQIIGTTSSMRDVRLLAASNDVDAVNAYDFRSAEEVRVYLKELERRVDELVIPNQGIMADAEKAVEALLQQARVVSSHKVTAAKITMDRSGDMGKMLKKLNDGVPTAVQKQQKSGEYIKLGDDFVVRNSQKLGAQFSLIQSLHNKMEILDAMELTIRQAFAGERSSLAANVATARKAVATKLKAALSFISKAAQKKEPKQFTSIVDPTVEEFLNRASGLYKGAAQQRNYLFVKTDKAGTLYFVFQRYVILQNFTSDQESFVYPQYVLVFTAAVSNEKKMTMHVTTLHSERPPGTFKFGSSFTTEKAALQELDSLLDMDKIVDLMSRTPLKDVVLEKRKFGRAKSLIQDVSVVDDKIRIKFTKKASAGGAQPVIEKTLLDLQALLGYGKGQMLKHKSIPQADKTLVIEFVLVPSAGARGKASLTERQRQLLETHFGFDDDDIRALTRIMHRGF